MAKEAVVPKQLTYVALFALVVMLFLIWQDPAGTADVIQSFFDSALTIIGDLWNRLGEFFGSFGS